MLGCYWFRGVVFAGDGSDHRGRMGAGAFCLGDPEMKQCVGVGREEEGTSSNRPELAALVLALRATKTTDDMLAHTGWHNSRNGSRICLQRFQFILPFLPC